MAIFKNSPPIVTDGLVLYLDAANTKSYPTTGTTWNDLGGRNTNGTLINGPTFNSNNLGGIVFDGVNDYVTVPNSIRTGIGFSGTIEVVTNCTGPLIFNERTDNNGGNGYFSVLTGLTLSIGVNSSNLPPYTYYINSSISGNTNQINHYIASYTIPSSTGTIRGIVGINNQFETLESPIVVRGPLSSFTTVDIGRQRNFVYSTTYCSPGSIFIVRIYNRQLSQTEMSQNYNVIKQRYNLT